MGRCRNRRVEEFDEVVNLRVYSRLRDFGLFIVSGKAVG